MFQAPLFYRNYLRPTQSTLNLETLDGFVSLPIHAVNEEDRCRLASIGFDETIPVNMHSYEAYTITSGLFLSSIRPNGTSYRDRVVDTYPELLGPNSLEMMVTTLPAARWGPRGTKDRIWIIDALRLLAYTHPVLLGYDPQRDHLGAYRSVEFLTDVSIPWYLEPRVCEYTYGLSTPSTVDQLKDELGALVICLPAVHPWLPAVKERLDTEDCLVIIDAI